MIPSAGQEGVEKDVTQEHANTGGVENDSASKDENQASLPASEPATIPEVGGRKGLEPTRYGDWEKNGRCIDF